jgi:hypothetical protein
MEIVHYKPSLQWVGSMHCCNCDEETLAWQSSGMSDLYPHFYCDTCSNVIRREGDYNLINENEVNQEFLDKIALTLPTCPCGGNFAVGADPKCPACKSPYKNDADLVLRLTCPFMIILDGARFYRDNLYPYEVCIGSTFKYYRRLLSSYLKGL